MKLSRLTNRQLRRLLRKGEVRFARIPWKELHKVVIGYLERTMNFYRETLRLLDNGYLRLNTPDEYKKFQRKIGDLFYLKGFTGDEDLLREGAYIMNTRKSGQEAVKNAIDAIKYGMNIIKEYIDDLKNDLQKNRIVSGLGHGLGFSDDVYNLKTHRWPNPASFFSEFRK